VLVQSEFKYFIVNIIIVEIYGRCSQLSETKIEIAAGSHRQTGVP
jgi:hypothetical protein